MIVFSHMCAGVYFRTKLRDEDMLQVSLARTVGWTVKKHAWTTEREKTYKECPPL